MSDINMSEPVVFTVKQLVRDNIQLVDRSLSIDNGIYNQLSTVAKQYVQDEVAKMATHSRRGSIIANETTQILSIIANKAIEEQAKIEGLIEYTSEDILKILPTAMDPNPSSFQMTGNSKNDIKQQIIVLEWLKKNNHNPLAIYRFLGSLDSGDPRMTTEGQAILDALKLTKPKPINLGISICDYYDDNYVKFFAKCYSTDASDINIFMSYMDIIGRKYGLKHTYQPISPPLGERGIKFYLAPEYSDHARSLIFFLDDLKNELNKTGSGGRIFIDVNPLGNIPAKSGANTRGLEYYGDGKVVDTATKRQIEIVDTIKEAAMAMVEMTQRQRMESEESKSWQENASKMRQVVRRNKALGVKPTKNGETSSDDKPSFPRL